MKSFLFVLSLWSWHYFSFTSPFYVSKSVYSLQSRREGSFRLIVYASKKEEELTKFLEQYNFRGAYEIVKNDPMIKLSKENAVTLLNNIGKLEPEPASTSTADVAKKGIESSSLIYRRLEKQQLLKGFNCLSDGNYPEIGKDITVQKLETIAGLPLTALTPKTRTTYWRVVGISLAVAELIAGFYFGNYPIFTLIPITIFAFLFDQFALKGAIFESIYQTLVPSYKKKVITHEAGHLLIAYLLGMPITGVVTNAWEARKYPEIQGSAGTIFFDPKFSEELEAQKLSRTSLDRLSIAFMAGIAAEAIEYGNCEGGAADEKSIISLFTSISPAWNILRIQGQARWAVAQCILLLREHKEAFKATIKALEENKPLGEIIFDIEKSLPVELPAKKRQADREILKKEKDRELLFRLVQRKNWNVGGIQPLETIQPSIEAATVEQKEPDQSEHLGVSEEAMKEEDPVDIFAKKIEMLQRAVSTGDLDVRRQNSGGGVWLNNLQALQQPSPEEEAIRAKFRQPSMKKKENPVINISALQDDMTTEQLLTTHRGYLMKEVELQEKENRMKVEKINQRLSEIKQQQQQNKKTVNAARD